MNIHICLISDQLLANFLPVKRDKPDKVFVVNTQYTEKKGLPQRFALLLQGLGIEMITANNLAPDDDFSQLHEYFLELSTEILALSAKNITLNLTGGTKLMALAAYEMLKDECQQVIYTNTQAGKIDQLHARAATPLPSLLTVEEYLTSYGVSIKSYNNQDDDWLAKVNQRKTLTKQLADYFSDSKNEKFLGTLNYKMNNAVETKNTATGGKQEFLSQPKQSFEKIFPNQIALLKQIAAAGLIDYDNHKTITLKDIDAAHYLGGFWLEEYVYHIAQDAKVDEVRCGQAIQWNKVTRNELDMVIVHNNRLLIMECKTAKFGEPQKDDQIIYKLDSIADDLRGLYGKSWLISVRHIADEPTISRAKSQGIEIISGSEIKNLRNKIITWMQST